MSVNCADGCELRPPDVPSIAVLPFADRNRPIFSEGMAEELINAVGSTSLVPGQPGHVT